MFIGTQQLSKFQFADVAPGQKQLFLGHRNSSQYQGGNLIFFFFLDKLNCLENYYNFTFKVTNGGGSKGKELACNTGDPDP